MALVAISFAAGIAAAQRWEFGAIVAAAALVVPVVSLVARGHKSTILICAALLILGAGRSNLSSKPSPTDISRLLPGVTAFEGSVASDVESRDQTVRFVLRAKKATLDARSRHVDGLVAVTLYPEAEAPPVRYGDILRIEARAYVPHPSTNPGQFSWRDHLARQGIHSSASVKRPGRLTVTPGVGGNPLLRTGTKIRDHIVAAIYRVHGDDHAPLIAGMALGTYAYLPDETFRAFVRTGTLHLLAASGFNCFVVVFLVGGALKLAGITPKWRAIATAIAVVAYLFIAGPMPSLRRATAMAVLYLLAVIVGRPSHLKNILFASALILLIAEPSKLFDVGFQLSYLSVGALVYVGPIISALVRIANTDTSRPKRSAGRRLWRKSAGEFAAVFAGTLTITLVTTPISAHYFNSVSLVSIPANVAMAGGVWAIFVDGLLCPVAAHYPPAAAALATVGGIVTNAMLRIVRYMGSLPYASVTVASPRGLGLCGYYAILLTALAYTKDRIRER